MNQFTKLLLAAIVGAFLLTASAAADSVIYLFRHAEKQSDGTRDPSLTEAGVVRASTLADHLKSAALVTVYSTDYKRTQETAAPVATAKQLTVQSYDPRKLGEFAEQLKKEAGPILVVGHSNTTPHLVSLLSGEKHGALEDYQYDHLYMVTLTDGGKASVSITYIEPRTPKADH